MLEETGKKNTHAIDVMRLGSTGALGGCVDTRLFALAAIKAPGKTVSVAHAVDDFRASPCFSRSSSVGRRDSSSPKTLPSVDRSIPGHEDLDGMIRKGQSTASDSLSSRRESAIPSMPWCSVQEFWVRRPHLWMLCMDDDG